MTQTIWWKLSSKVMVVLAVGLSPMAVHAQSNFETYKKQYPDFNELIVNNTTSYTISIVDKKLKVIQDNQYESMILSDNGIQNNKESFSYSDFVKLISYDAYTIVSNSGKEKKIKVTQALEKQSRGGSVFHDDVKVKQMSFPNLEAGAKKVFEYTTEFTDPNLLHKFIFGEVLPVKNASLEIKVDKNVNIGFKLFNDPNHQIAFNKIEKKDYNLYQWTLKDGKPIKFEGNAPSMLYSVPHLIFYIEDYTADKNKVTLLGDIQRMYTYYSGFVENLNAKEDKALKEIALTITANKNSEEEKIKAIFYWVKDNIKYIAFENGYEGFIPREAALVNERKFGDCKDMASIITAMAKYAGVSNTYLAWIGTRNIPYSFSEVATPSTTDHMIAVYKKGSEYIFLDATDQETAYGLPSAFIQDKEALLYNGDKYQIVKVPITPPAKNLIHDAVVLSLNNEKITGSGWLQISGYNRTNTLGQLGDAANKTRFEMIKSLVLKGNNKFTLNDYCEANTKDRDKPYEVGYDFDIENYIVKVDKELYLNLVFDKYYEKSNLEKDREANYDFDNLNQFISTVTCVIPNDYEVKYVPKNFELDNELIKVQLIYHYHGNTVSMKATLETKKIMLEKKDFALWNETVKKLKSGYSETIILKEK
jgi:hypothetical protein